MLGRAASRMPWALRCPPAACGNCATGSRATGLIEDVATYEFALRLDFKARILHRERAIIVVLRRRRAGEEQPVDDAEFADVEDAEIDVYDSEAEHAPEEADELPDERERLPSGV